ncbi:MAG: SIMPL domain-containing protein [Thioalkalivibrionaceae bacterium]
MTSKAHSAMTARITSKTTSIRPALRSSGLRLITIGTAMLLTHPALAHDTETGTRPEVHLSTHVTERLSNDTMRAHLEIRERANELAKASEAANARISALADRLRETPNITVENQRYQSVWLEPSNARRSDKNPPDHTNPHWEIIYTVTLMQHESEAINESNPEPSAFEPAFAELSALIGEFQTQDIALTGVSFDVSRTAQDEARVRLLPRAIQALENQAKATAAALGATGIRAQRVQVHEDFGGYAQAMRADVASVAMAPEVGAPRFDRGDSEIRLSVSGTFNLIDPPVRVAP